MKLHLPYHSEKTHVRVGTEVVDIKAFQIVVWMSLLSEETTTWDDRMAKFPAILDIGTTHNFAITNAHLMRWAGIHPASLRELGRLRIESRIAPLFSAGLWLHTDHEPFSLKVMDGIAILEGDWPRLPVLGLRAITNNQLRTFIYGDTKQVLIRTPPKWYWPF